MTDDYRTERAGSFASSSTDAATLHELTKLDPMEDSVQNLKSHDDEELGTEEDEKLLPKANEKEEPQKSSMTSAIIWMTVNTLATIGIVSIPPKPAGSYREKNMLTIIFPRSSPTRLSSPTLSGSSASSPLRVSTSWSPSARCSSSLGLPSLTSLLAVPPSGTCCRFPWPCASTSSCRIFLWPSLP